MPQSTAVVDQLLTGVSNKIQPAGFIADEVLPEKQVDMMTGKVGRYGGEHLRIQQTISAQENGFPRVESITYNTDTYSIEPHGLKDYVFPADYANVNKPFDAEKDKTAVLTTALKLGREKALADSLTSTSVLTNNTTLSGNDQYNNRDHADSTPLTDFATARETVYDAVGMAPNYAIMSWKVWNHLRYHSQMLDALGYKDNRPGGLSLEELAKAMEVEKILVGKAIYNTANKGQTDSFSPVWGKDIVFYVRPSAPAIEQTSLGYKLTLRGKNPFAVYKYNHDEPAGSMKIVCENYYDDLLQKVTAAYLIKNAVA
jgi:hypothetical protein